MDAEQEYQTHPSLFLVHVWIYSTATFTPGPGWDEFWQKLSVVVEQGKPLRPEKTHYIPRSSRRGPSGTEFELQFDAMQVTSAVMTIRASGPGAQSVEAKFDLSKLK